MPEYAKDVMITLLGAAVGLAGLLLIFSGFLFAQADSFPKATTDDAIINRYRNAGRFAVIPFLVSFAVAFLALTWMIHPVPCIYWITVCGFGVLLAVSASYGGFVLIRYL
jgi:hypothetical protein